MQSFFSDSGLTYYHAQLLMLVVNGLFIWMVGPKNLIPTFHRRLRPYIYGYLALGFLFGFLSPFFYGDGAYVPHWIMATFVVFAGCLLGITFWAAKIHRPVVYGAIEIGAGIVGLVIVGFFNPAPSVIGVVFGSATSVYIIVRGLSNINDALKAADVPELPMGRSRRKKPERPATPKDDGPR